MNHTYKSLSLLKIIIKFLHFCGLIFKYFNIWASWMDFFVKNEVEKKNGVLTF